MLEGNDLPPALPTHLPNGGEELRYHRISAESFRTDKRTTTCSSGRAPVTPITKEVMPWLPDSLFNAQGYMQQGDTIICVQRMSVYKKFKNFWREQALKNNAGLGTKEHPRVHRETINTNESGRVSAEMVSGIGMSSPGHG